MYGNSQHCTETNDALAHCWLFLCVQDDDDDDDEEEEAEEEDSAACEVFVAGGARMSS